MAFPEAGMAQLDDIVGTIMKKLDDMGEAENTILVFSTDNGAEVFTWPDGGMTPFRSTKGTIHEGGFRVPCIARWPGQIKPGTVENGNVSDLDWFPTLVAAAGDPDIVAKLKKGVMLGDRTYKNHLDGYNQMDLLLGKGPSVRHEVWYFGGPKLGAVRLDATKFTFFQQPTGWPGPKFTTGGASYFTDFFAREFWRFVLVQDKVKELAETAIEFPPMQDPASLNLDAVKKQVEDMIKARHGQ